jgi:hypothetical protein
MKKDKQRLHRNYYSKAARLKQEDFGDDQKQNKERAREY